VEKGDGVVLRTPKAPLVDSRQYYSYALLGMRTKQSWMKSMVESRIFRYLIPFPLRMRLSKAAAAVTARRAFACALSDCLSI